MPTWEQAVECAWCGSRTYRERFRVNGRAYVECDGCSIVRLYDRVAFANLDSIYGDYFDPRQARLTPAELDSQLANPTFAWRHARLAAVVPQPLQSMFEIGCGDGNFLGYLRRRGWEVDGCEYGAVACEFVRSRHGIEVRLGDFESLNLRPASLNVVGAYAVLEHLYEPLRWLRAIRHTLAPDGVLHLQLPNLHAWDYYLTGTCWSLIGFPEHVYFYHPQALVRMLEREGFDVLSVTTYDPWHGPGNVLASGRNLLKHYMTGWQPWQPAEVADTTEDRMHAPPATRTQFFNTLARPAAVALARLQSWFGYGNNIDVVARVSKRVQSGPGVAD